MQRLTPLQISPNHEEYITRLLEPIAHASARADATGNAEEDVSVNTSVGTNSDLGGLENGRKPVAQKKNTRRLLREDC